MGSIPAHHGYTAFHFPLPYSHENLSPQTYYPEPGDHTAAPTPEHFMSFALVDLSTRLAVLERDYQNCQAENAKKEVVIQYLLHSNVGQGPSEKKVIELGDQVSSLKVRNSELTKDVEQLRNQLQQALDIIFTFSTPIAAGFTAQPAQTKGRDCGEDSKTTSVDLVQKTDLIDLLECVEGSADVKLNGEETTWLEDDYDDVPVDGGEIGKTAADRSLSPAFSSDLTDESSYIHRFVRDKSKVKLHEVVKRAAMEVDDVLHSPKIRAEATGRFIVPRSSAGFDTFFPEDLSTPSGPASASAVQFIPGRSERNIYRTVKLCGLPSTVMMKGLLDRVRGGMVVDVKLLDTATMTGGKTALVTFLREHAAMAYEEFAQDHSLDFDGAVAQITVINTPTWPIPMKLRKNIQALSYTRCLEIQNFPRNVLPSALKQELAVSPVLKYNGLESMSMSGDGTLGLRFSSVKFAVRASAMFGLKPRYRKCSVRFAPDPCAQPLETLLEVLKPEPNGAVEASTTPTNNTDPQMGSSRGWKDSRNEIGLVNEVGLLASVNVDPELTAMDKELSKPTKIELKSQPQTLRGQGAEIEH
ncbi:hypothetical protein N7G274_001674 [Stereocaulon virgatum]|uniref:Uncharacterized protein n=1 Tax=Stereocaulon virgatum TaxID=373712 RepID=A0ABR4AKD0_9LECA